MVERIEDDSILVQCLVCESYFFTGFYPKKEVMSMTDADKEKLLKDQEVVPVKPAYKSASMRGILIVLLPVIVRTLRLAGVPIPELPYEQLVDLILQIVGGAYGVYGVLRRKDITLW
jgi:hypothetical protein